jgi:transposase
LGERLNRTQEVVGSIPISSTIHINKLDRAAHYSQNRECLTDIESALPPATLGLPKTKSRKGAAAMKNQAIQYLALDVHQATTVATVRDESGSIRMRATVATEAGAIVALVRGLSSRVHVAFEEGTQAQWLHDLLQPYVERVIVCNVRGRSETTNKSDRIDADWLSEMLRIGSIKAVHHGSTNMLTLKELVRCYTNLVDDSTRVMLRLKAIFRARAITTPGKSAYRASQRKLWLSKLESRGARLRAAALYEQLDVLMKLRPAAKAAMIAEARRHSGWKILRSVPFIGPVRAALLLAIMATPFRFRTKRQLWPYAGLAVVTRSTSDQEIVDGKLRRRKRAPLTRGLNRNHNPVLKSVFKGAATVASASDGPLKEFYDRCVARGVDEEMAKLTLARKLASIVLRLWKKGELWNPAKLTMQTT